MAEKGRNRELEEMAFDIVKAVENKISEKYIVSSQIPPEVLMKKFTI